MLGRGETNRYSSVFATHAWGRSAPPSLPDSLWILGDLGGSRFFGLGQEPEFQSGLGDAGEGD